MKKLLFILFVGLTFVGFAQESNKKKVLVIPYNRFEFVSEYDLSEIAKKNEVTENEVFLLYQKTILSTFENYVDENFEFVSVKHDLIKPHKNSIKYESGKCNGKRYNAVNLESFSKEDFQQFLEAQGCDFAIFITWHDIQKEAYIKNTDRRNRTSYAGHYLDYDVFNLFQYRVIGEGRVKATVKPANDTEASFTLLRTTELSKALNNFIAHVVEQLNNPIN